MSELTCAVCIYVSDDDAAPSPAVTVLAGYAVCEYHMSFVAQTTDWHTILRDAKIRRALR